MKTKTRRNHLSGLAAALALLAGATFTQTARADSVWNKTGSANWNVSGNWDGGLPDSSSNAYINNSGTAVLSAASGDYNLLGLGADPGDSGTINITGGVLSGNYTYVGYQGSGNATITSGTWSNSSELIVGLYGTGSLLVNGGYVSSYFGNIGITGTGNVTVTSGTWSNSATLNVGLSGTGSLLIDGGYVSSSDGWIGNNNTGAGSVTFTGGAWSSSSLIVGLNGTGNLLINGGQVSSAEGYLGRFFESNGTATVTGEGSTWVNSGNLTIGRDGSNNNTLTIEDGGLVKVGDSSGETISFSLFGGTDNYLRLDGGYIALYSGQDDQTAYITSLITAGNIQLWDGEAWVTATVDDVQIAFYADDEEGEAAAQAATGYSGLGGYTVATAVPEPSAWLLAAAGGSALLFFRRRARTGF